MAEERRDRQRPEGFRRRRWGARRFAGRPPAHFSPPAVSCQARCRRL